MPLLDDVRQDVAFAIRLLRRSPAFTAAIALTLALGVGVNTAVFSVVNAAVLRPLPVRDGHRMVVIASHDTSSRELGPVSFRDLEEYRTATADVFEDVAGYSVGFLGLSREGGPAERVLATTVTGSYFPLLDIEPALGRLIRPDEGGRGRDAVVVLGYSAWQRRFGGDPLVVGRTVRVNGRLCTVIGVAPRDFSGTFAFSDSELYLPLNWSGPAAVESGLLHALARLRPGVSIDAAQAAMNVVAERLARQSPESNADVAAQVVPERLARPEEAQSRTTAPGATMTIAMVALVMVVAAVNVANLLLARAASRRQELTIRAALGAGRGRLARQMVTESLLLAALGGSGGLVLGTWAAGALAAVRVPGDLPVRFDFHLDGRVLAYAASVAIVSGVLAGLLPAMRVAGAGLHRAVRQVKPGAASDIPRGWLRGSLVVAQMAICFALLAVAGSFVRSLFEAERADLGFRPDGVLNVHMDVGQLGYTEAQGRTFFDDVERRVRSMPGVEHVSFAFTIPLDYIRVSAGVEAEGRPAGRGGPVSAGKNNVSPEYFQTMRIPLVRGRSFGEADTRQSRPVAIVNEQLAGMLWPGRDPIGQRFRAGAPTEPWLEVVGVTATGTYEFLFEEPRPYFYVPIAQHYTALRVLQVRTSLPPVTLATPIQRAIHDREPNLPLYDVQTMPRALGSGLGLFLVRIGAFSAAALGLLALALAVVGLYGVVSYLASQRRHEIGVRMAIGATRRDIIRLVSLEGLSLVALGLAAGLVIVLLGSRVVAGFLFGVSPLDPLTLAGVAAVLGGAALLACTLPGRRAAGVDPLVALRAE